MATCKDCHNCAFDLMCTYMGDWVGIRTPCPAFKDKSRFLELPCSPGDHVYVVFPKAKAAVEHVIVSIWVEEAGVIVRAVDTTCFTFGFFMAQEFGKKLFFTKEEAEKALKERENNDKTDN